MNQPTPTHGGGSYTLGVDLGTTFTAAATNRDGFVRVVDLGNRAITIPSVVALRDDGVILVGEPAEYRAVLEADRVAREFKRRLGDSVPLLLGGSPFSAEALTGHLLRWVIERVTEREGAAPAHICLTHPASWGPFKLDVFRHAVRMAGLEPDALTFVSEPAAAALAYAADQRLPIGARVAVYDLGGGTFDATVLEYQGDSFGVVGEPGGLERLGGIDFDEALFHFVLDHVAGSRELLEQNGDRLIADVVTLRRACIEAKEFLSVDLDTNVSVRLGSLTDVVRVHRKDFEGLLVPTLTFTVESLRRTILAAGLEPSDLHAILLVGGSSRIPAVGDLLQRELGRPVALDVHPKHVVALGAALSTPQTPASAAAAVPVPVPADVVAAVPLEATLATEQAGHVDQHVEQHVEQHGDQHVELQPPATPGLPAAAAVEPDSFVLSGGVAPRSKRLVALAAGVLFGLLVVVGGAAAKMSAGSGDTNPATTSTTSTTASPTSRPSDISSAAFKAVPAQARNGALAWIKFENDENPSLGLATVQTRASAACQRVLERAAKQFGDITDATDNARYPTKLPTYAQRMPEPMGKAFLTDAASNVKRWEACAAGDFSQQVELAAAVESARCALLIEFGGEPCPPSTQN